MRELIQRAGITARQARYLIAEGFVPPPTGGRTYAQYGEAHLRAVVRYQRLRKAGFSPASIRLLLRTRTGIPFEVVSGVTLSVNPALIASDLSIEDLRSRLELVLERILSMQTQEDSDDN